LFIHNGSYQLFELRDRLAAQDYGATCIVMGTTGKSPLKELFSKSYSYRVAEASVVPTLVIP